MFPKRILDFQNMGCWEESGPHGKRVLKRLNSSMAGPNRNSFLGNLTKTINENQSL